MTRPAEALVLFDIDGTLMRGAGQQHKEALVEGIRKVTGLATTLEGVATSGMLDRDLITQMLRVNGASERRIRNALPQVVRECQHLYLTNCRLDLSPYLCARVRETLSELRSMGAVLGLVTGNLSGIGWRKLELAGLREYFLVGAFAEDGRTRARLACVAARRAIREKHVSSRPRVSLIGDHANDVLAAKANGFRAVAVATGLTPFEELAAHEPDVLVRDLSELDLSNLL